MIPPAAVADRRPSTPWEGEARVEVFQTTDLFPGGEAPEPDWGTRFTVEPRWSARMGPQWRLRPWVRWVMERYRDWPSRDVTRWTVGADLKHGPHRLRLYGGWSRNELYFPSPTGDARFDRVGGGCELRVGIGAAWLAQITAAVTADDFVSIYDERDDTCWTLQSSLERNFGEERRLRMVHVYRRSDSISGLYTYEQNSMRAEADWRVAGWDVSAQGEAGLRNYRTGQSFAPNFARQDDRWRVRAGIGRVISRHLTAQAFGEQRRNESTRPTKVYDVTTVGLAMLLSK
jgi:hypothetical protein